MVERLRRQSRAIAEEPGVTRVPSGVRLVLKDQISLKSDELEQIGEVAERLKARPC